MKKIFYILFLGLFLNSCATPTSDKVQTELINTGNIKMGMSFYEINEMVNLYFYYPLKKTSKKYAYGTTNSAGSEISYGFEAKKLKGILTPLGDYKLVKIFKTSLERYNYYLSFPDIDSKDRVKLLKYKNMILDHEEHVANQKKKKENEKKAKDEKAQLELAEMINKAKNTCTTLGFSEGTDKFTDCTLKLYTQEVDNKVALKVAKQKSSSSSSSGSMVIYDPVRDRQNQIDRGMKMLSGGCTLGIDC